MTDKPITMTNALIATTSTSSKDDMSREQEGMMREWIITKMSPKLSVFLNQVRCPWDRSELLLTNIKKLGYTDITLRYEHDDYADEWIYKPYFKLNTLASLLGYSRPRDLFKAGGILSDCTKYYLKSGAVPHRLVPGDGDCIVPDHLCMASDSNKYNCIYIDINACEALVTSASRIPKFKDNALSFKNLLADLNRVSVIIISRLNQLVTEYRYQQQTQHVAQLEANQKAYEDIANQRKRLEEETKLLALKTYPDVTLEKSHYGYIFSSDEYMANDMYKLGITDNLKNREQDAQTYCPTGKFLYTLETYDARSTETALHQALKRRGLHYKISSGNEWFKIPGLDEAKKLLELATNNTNALYDYVATYPDLLRQRFAITDKPSVPMITDAPANAPPIADYVKDVTKKLIDMNASYISKTNMIQLLKKTAHESKYKNYKAVLPIDLEAFIANDNIQGIRLTKKTTKKTMSISIDIESSDG